MGSGESGRHLWKQDADALSHDRIVHMLRLDPSYPPVWRTDSTLQFGAEPVAVLDDPEPWQQRMLRELERGIPDGAGVAWGQALGAPDAASAGRFVSRIRKALTTDSATSLPVLLHRAEDVRDRDLDTVAAGLASAGCDVRIADRFGPVRPSATTTVAFVAHRMVSPQSAASLMSADVEHIPIALTGSGAEVGPYVAPGRNACLACVVAHRRDRDPAWPAVAAQLMGLHVESEPAVLWEAGIVAARLIAERARNPSGVRTRSVVLRAGSLHRHVRSHHPHAECRCRSLGGTAKADDLARLSTTTEKAFGRPA